jgi:NADH-quinone oxidoreductase subunit J
MFAQIFFTYCAVMITGSALVAIHLRNPVHSVLMVLVLFFHMAGLYLLLNAEFLAAVQVIVYAGAILVLYLFVMLLVNLRQEITLDRFVENRIIGALIAVSLCVVLFSTLPTFTLGEKGKWTVEAVKTATHTKALGLELYSTYILPFEVCGLILLIAVIGGLMLARKDRNRDNHENAIPDHENAPLSEEVS